MLAMQARLRRKRTCARTANGCPRRPGPSARAARRRRRTASRPSCPTASASSANALIQPSELRARARRWRDAVNETLDARPQSSLESAWAVLDGNQDAGSERGTTLAEPAGIKEAFDQATQSAPNWEAMARRSEAARELLEASDRNVRKVDVDVTLGTNITATGLALLPLFGVTGLGAMPIVGVQLAPEELRQLDVARTGAEANLYTRLRDKAAADADLDVTRAAIDASYLDRQIALYVGELRPELQAAQDGSLGEAPGADGGPGRPRRPALAPACRRARL